MCLLQCGCLGSPLKDIKGGDTPRAPAVSLPQQWGRLAVAASQLGSPWQRQILGPKNCLLCSEWAQENENTGKGVSQGSQQTGRVSKHQGLRKELQTGRASASEERRVNVEYACLSGEQKPGCTRPVLGLLPIMSSFWSFPAAQSLTCMHAHERAYINTCKLTCKHAYIYHPEDHM